jgi:hypothetical protein
MSAHGVDDYLPRHQFLIDLLDFITSHQALGDKVLLGMDANPSVGIDNQLDAFLQASNLVDLYSLRHGMPAPSTYNGGRTLDFIYGTALLQTSLRSIGVCKESEALDSDHRALFADFAPSVLFDNKNEDPTSAGRRNLKLSNRQAVLDYQTLFVARCISRNIIARVHSLNEFTLTPDHDKLDAIALYEALDADITWAMLSSEQEVTNGSNGTHPFSPSFSDAGNSIRHWKRQIKLTIDHSMEHVLIPSQVSGVLSTNHYLAFCRHQLSESWRKFRSIKAESIERRQAYLDACLAEAIKETHRANTLHKIISAEAVARLYKRLRFFVKGTSTSSISHVLVPDENESTGYRRVSQKEELFQSILARNLAHFGQASATPFVDGSQGDQAPPFTYTDAHDDMLHGTYTAENAEFEEV